ncbi:MULTISPECIES: helix-turn-helix domain-containing protein [unclassified Streptomyces]|uniref:helix-turn-helix domain-containing protein n=1 Tax=unclassified Streptomyces TaxID=2593676 RepID=UPI00336A018B
MAGDEPLTWRALGAVPLFASVPEARLRELWAASVPRGHPVGSVLRQAGAPGPARVRSPGTQQALADTLGVTRVTVNRALARLRRDGLIRVERDCAHLLAPESLALRAGDEREHRDDTGPCRRAGTDTRPGASSSPCFLMN